MSKYSLYQSVSSRISEKFLKIHGPANKKLEEMDPRGRYMISVDEIVDLSFMLKHDNQWYHRALTAEVTEAIYHN